MFILSLLISCSAPTPHVINRDIKVLVIDSGIGRNSRLSRVVYLDTPDYSDFIGHGTHVAGLIQSGAGLGSDVCPQVKIYSCKSSPGDNRNLNIDGITNCMKRAQDEHFNYVNISAGGPVGLSGEYIALRDFKGTIYASAGNDSKVLTNEFQFYPASYTQNIPNLGYLENLQYKRILPLKNIKVVYSMCDGLLCKYSNYQYGAIGQYGKPVLSTLPHNRFGYMKGTSMATALALHAELMLRCKNIQRRVK